MRRKLDMTADRIEACLASEKLTARVWGGTVGAHSATFTFTLAAGCAIHNPRRLAEELSLALGRTVRLYQMPGYWRVRVFDWRSL